MLPFGILLLAICFIVSVTFAVVVVVSFVVVVDVVFLSAAGFRLYVTTTWSNKQIHSRKRNKKEKEKTHIKNKKKLKHNI